MNKSLFRLGGSILAFESLFILLIVFPDIAQSFSPQILYASGGALMLTSVLLMLASGIGSLLIKTWSVVTLWLSLIFSFVVSVMIGGSYPSFIPNGFSNWVVILIIAVYMTIEWKKTKKN